MTRVFMETKSTMFKDVFERPHSPVSTRVMTPTEQTFWRIVRMNPELSESAESLKQKGQFKPIEGAGASYVRYVFTWNGQLRHFEAQITPNTNAIQLKNFLSTCTKGVNGVFEQPNIHAYMRQNRRPL